MFTEQSVDNIQGCGDWDAGEENRDIKGDSLLLFTDVD